MREIDLERFPHDHRHYFMDGVGHMRPETLRANSPWEVRTDDGFGARFRRRSRLSKKMVAVDRAGKVLSEFMPAGHLQHRGHFTLGGVSYYLRWAGSGYELSRPEGPVAYIQAGGGLNRVALVRVEALNPSQLALLFAVWICISFTGGTTMHPTVTRHDLEVTNATVSRARRFD